MKRLLSVWAVLLLAVGSVQAQNYEMLAAAKKDGKWGYLDSIGKAAIPFSYDAASPFHEKAAVVKSGKFYGFINQKNEWVLRPIFPQAEIFSNNHAYINFFDFQDSMAYFGYVTRSGNFRIILDPMETGYNFSEGLVRIQSADVNGIAFGFRDTLGNWVINPRFDAAGDFSMNRAPVMLGDKWGFIDTKGKYTVFPDYEAAFGFSEGMGYLKKGNEITFVDTTGKPVLKLKKMETDVKFREDMLAYRVKGKVGYLNKKGKVAIKARYDTPEFTKFSEGLAAVAVNEGGKLKWGYINAKGKMVIAPQFESAEAFSFNRAVIKQNGKYGVINSAGTIIVPPVYDFISPYTQVY